MAVSFNDIPKTVQDGEALLRDINKSIQNTHALRYTTKTQYGSWRTKAKTVKKPQRTAKGTDSGAGAVLETLFMSFLMQSLCGLPMFDGVDPDGMQGLGFLGSSMYHDAAGGKKTQPQIQFKAINQALIDAQKTRVENALSGQYDTLETLASMKKAVMMMLMVMMLQQEETAGERGGSGGDMIAPDALRHPRLGQFKQNRHSLSCVRKMFQDQAVTFVPKFPQLRCV